MMSPLDLTIEELQVYKLLYSKMDTETFQTRYSLDDLVKNSDFKLNLTKKKVSRIIKNFISENLITEVEKGNRAKATLYEMNIQEFI